MDLRQLRYFVAAVEGGSLHAAAQRLAVAQPALSRRVRDLEEALGCMLLTRGSRGIEPTHAGATLYRDAVQLLAGVDEAARRTRRAGLERDGIVRLGLMPGARKYPFVCDVVVDSFAERSPPALAFTRTASADLAIALREGRLDLALLYERHLGSADFHERAIHRERYVLAAHPGHRLAIPDPVDLTALKGEGLVWLSRRDTEGEQDRLLQACRHHGLEPRIAHVAHSPEEQLDLTAVGVGLCLTPASTIAAVPAGQLAFRPIPLFRMELPLALAWRRDAAASVQAVIARFQTAIEAHQDAIARGAVGWTRLHGHDLVVVDRDAIAPL